MKVYLDSSVLLRVVLGQSGRLREWSRVREGVASALVEVECLRALDRLRLRGHLSEKDLASRRETVYNVLESVSLVEPTRPVLVRASQPFPTPLGTLDALHLATALLWRDAREPDLVLGTHDEALGTAARACGLRVMGV